MLLRKPFLLLFVLGCTVSALASGRFSLRLIADGAVSFVFLPAFEMLALRLVQATKREGASAFSRTCDRFFAGNWPWLLWLIGLSTVAVLVPPRRFGFWLGPLAASAVVPFLWSLVIDFRFFRGAAGQPTHRAIRDLVIERGIAWPLGVAYFFGIAIWSDQLPAFLHWIGL